MAQGKAFFEMLAWFSNTNEWVDKNFGNTILGTSTDQAMVFQKPVLLKRSVIENLKFAWPKKTQRDSVDNALSLARLQDKQHFPAKLLSGANNNGLRSQEPCFENPNCWF